MNTTALIEQLKAAGEDFEFYPTTRDMVKTIWDHHRKYSDGSPKITNFGAVLDIGCGTCNFRRWVKEFNDELAKTEKDGDRYTVNIYNYYVMEKSRILLDKLDSDIAVLGTDFNEATLIDKPVDTIFCNPPYKEYENWTARIITESVCQDIYLIIPRRWKQSEKITLALKRLNLSAEPHTVTRCEFLSVYKENHTDVEVIGSADFLDAERSARAKVDILHISKKYTSKDASFDTFFDDVFGMPDMGKQYDFERVDRQSEEEALKTALLAGKNKVEILCNGYAEKQNQLFEHFKTICGLDTGVLKAIGVHKDAVKDALKKNFEGLKNLYWNAAFNCLDEITSRLTSQSRKALMDRFTLLKTVDFTPSNIYALIVWVIKNANQYTEKQMIDFFMALSSKENVRNYVSNKRAFDEDRWRYQNEKYRNTHYTLDYRIVVTKYALPGEAGCEYSRATVRDIFHTKISDICTVANNLGFPAESIDIPQAYGARGFVKTTINGKPETLFEFRCYQNRNVHIKFNMEFMKALNVSVARKLGWIHSKSDIAREFTPEMAKGAERYFDAFKGLSLDAGTILMLPESPEPETTPEPETSEPTAPETVKPESNFTTGTLF